MKDIISLNPADNQVVGQVQASTFVEIDQAVECAQQARLSWKNVPIEERVQRLSTLIDKFKAEEAELGRLISAEMGKTQREVIDEFAGVYHYLDAFLTEGPKYLADEYTVESEQQTHFIRYEPIGVVASIAPWNFPFSNFIWSVIPNLIAGNTVVFKHSEDCPLVGQALDEIMQSLSLPEGVYSQIYGDAEEGEYLASNNIDMIFFTGGSKAGLKLQKIAGEKGIKCVLELGGSNPTILFGDINVDDYIKRIFEGRFENCGQVCDALKRLIVHESIFDEVVSKLTKVLASKKIDMPLLDETDFGPLASGHQKKILLSQLQDAVELGGALITPLQIPEHCQGAFVQPTLITQVKQDMRVWREEVFGPVLPIISFSTTEEAVALANDTIYGLGAVVCAADTKFATSVANQIDAGFVEINHGNHWRACNPFGGYKASGVGREHGRHGFQELTQIKVMAFG